MNNQYGKRMKKRTNMKDQRKNDNFVEKILYCFIYGNE